MTWALRLPSCHGCEPSLGKHSCTPPPQTIGSALETESYDSGPGLIIEPENLVLPAFLVNLILVGFSSPTTLTRIKGSTGCFLRLDPKEVGR